MSLFYLLIRYENSDHPTFGGLAQTPDSFSDQGYRGDEIEQFERTAEDEGQTSEGGLGK